MKNKRTTNKRRVVASVLSLLMVMQQSATYQAMAESTITNVDGVGLSKDNGVYNITPDMVDGDVGFRKFDQFKLEPGDVANFIFKMYNRYADGNAADTNYMVSQYKDINTFIAAVNNGSVNINGIVNALTALPNGATGFANENGTFKPDSHLVFVAPGGVVVGASGVLNVGSLSAYTPTQSAYNAFASDIQSARMFESRDNYHTETITTGPYAGAEAQVWGYYGAEGSKSWNPSTLAAATNPNAVVSIADGGKVMAAGNLTVNAG